MSDPTPSGREPSLPFEPDRTGDEPSLGGENLWAEVRAAMGSSDPAMQRAALNRLRQINTPQAFNLLLEQLAHPSPDIRAITAVQLAVIRSAQAVPALIAAIRTEDDRQQNTYDTATRLSILHRSEEACAEAVEAYRPVTALLLALGKCAAAGDESAREQAAAFVASLLKRNLARYEVEVKSFDGENIWSLEPDRHQAINLMFEGLLAFTTTLRAIPHPAAIPALLDALWHVDGHIDGSAAGTLNDICERYPDPAIHQPVVEGAFAALRASDIHTRHAGNYILVNRGEEIVPRLIALITDFDPLNRRGAIETLHRFIGHRDQRITEPGRIEHIIGLLTTALNDSNDDVRLAAAEGFEHLSRSVEADLLRQAIPALTRLLSDPYGDQYGTIGDRSASALENMGTTEALAALAVNPSA